MISCRSMVSMSWCIYWTLIPAFLRYAVRSSAIFLVRVVTSTRSCRSARWWISPMRSSIWPSTGRTSTSGSSRPVGRITCSTICPDRVVSYSPGVAETYTTWWIFCSNSSNFRGRLSKAQGSRKP